MPRKGAKGWPCQKSRSSWVFLGHPLNGFNISAWLLHHLSNFPLYLCPVAHIYHIPLKYKELLWLFGTGYPLMTSAPNPTKKPRFPLLARLRGYFFAGVLVIAPLSVTVAIASWFVELVDNRIVPLIPSHLNPDTYIREVLGVEFGLPGLGVIVLLIGITLIGAFAAGLLGRWILRTGERVLAQMPIIRTLYSGTKQILETILKNQNEAFRQVALIEYPRPGLWAVAFVTSNTQQEIARRLETEHVNVFLPTTPNPTSGFLLFVPRKDLVVLDMTVEEAVKMVISAGIVTPVDLKSPKPPLTVPSDSLPEKAAKAVSAHQQAKEFPPH